MPSTPSTGIPPQPPSVKQQQNPGLNQFAEGAMGATGAQGTDAGAGKAFVAQGFKDVATTMTRMAKVISVESPELMPIFVRAAGAMKVLETEFNKTQQGQGSPQGQGSEPTPASSEGSDSMGDQ